MTSKLYQTTYLLFIARQGYWNNGTNVKLNKFWIYIYQYVLGSIGVALLMGTASRQIMTYLSTLNLFKVIPVDDCLIIGSFVVLFAGLIYENLFLNRAKTREVFRIFFNSEGLHFELALLVKNLIIVSPVLVMGLFFNPFLAIALLAIGHIVSFRPVNRVDVGKKLLVNLTMRSYTLSVISFPFFLKSVVTSVTTFCLILIMLSFDSLFAVTGNKVLLFSAALILGGAGFSSRSLLFLFLALIKDLPYLKATGVSISKFLRARLLLLSLFHFVVVTYLPLLVYFRFYPLSGQDSFFFYICLVLVFIANQSIQMKNALFFKDKYLNSAKELESCKLPIKEQVKTFLVSCPLVLVGLILQVTPHIINNWILTLLMLSLLLMAFVYMAYSFNQWIK